jgi:RNA polymerase sigma-70 factor (ECF subfamily)
VEGGWAVTRGVGQDSSDRAGALADQAALLDALREGSSEAFGALVLRHHPVMVELAATLVGSRAIAEEVVQDTWMAVLRGLDRFEGRSSLRTWLFRILVNRAKSTRERERRLVRLPLDLDPGEDGPSVDPARFNAADHPTRPGHWLRPPVHWTSDVERRLLDKEARKLIHDTLERAPTGQRSVMLLRDVAGLSSAEVRAALGISAANERVLLHRARTRVRAALEAYVAEESDR